MKLNCYESYVQGARHRLHSPLHEGLYKINDFRDHIDQWHCELIYIRRFIAGQDSRPQFLCCTRGELAGWLKRLPALIAYDIGHDLLPGMEALTLNGVSHKLIAQERAHVQSRAYLLLSRLDQLSQALYRGIGTEYEHMRKGKSRLESLTKHAINLADRVIQIGNSHHGSCGPVPNLKTGKLAAQSLFKDLS